MVVSMGDASAAEDRTAAWHARRAGRIVLTGLVAVRLLAVAAAATTVTALSLLLRAPG